MNLLHAKHAVAVATYGSLSKASEVLLVATPNISRSIKELEAELGISIFERTPKGMALTPDGEEFINFAKGILGQIDQLENFYKKGTASKKKFSISVPRASYICEAFAEFSKTLSAEPVEVFYKETNSQRTIDNILNHDYKLGIIRYAENYDKYFKSMLEEKDMSYELITEFSYVLIMSSDNPLSERETVTFDDLADYIEIAHADPYVPSMPLAKVVKEELHDNIDRRIFVFERASQFELLSQNTNTFMWVSPMPEHLLHRYGLVQKKSEGHTKIYRDLLIYKNGYKLSELDRQFISQLHLAKEYFTKENVGNPALL